MAAHQSEIRCQATDENEAGIGDVLVDEEREESDPLQSRAVAQGSDVASARGERKHHLVSLREMHDHIQYRPSVLHT